MRSEALELVLSEFFQQELKQFTSKEFMKFVFELCGNNNSLLYTEQLGYFYLRTLKNFGCIKLVSSGSTKIYELNINQIKKTFPSFKDFDFSKKEKEKAVK